MTDCTSLIDPKTHDAPVLYLPSDLATPAAVAALKAKCGVGARRLPQVITHQGSLMPDSIAAPGLLYLPNAYVVPGGRFNEMYGWDSYFVLLGLEQDGHRDLARGMVENFFFEIGHYGALLNANRTYYLTRSHPPLLGEMIRLVYNADAAAGTNDAAKQWLANAYTYAVRDHALWLTPAHQAGKTGLARYHDLGTGPVPEMADASSYYPDVIRWLLAHPNVHTRYLADGPDVPEGKEPTPAQAALIARVSCDPRHSETCVRAHVGTHWLSPAFYKSDRAMRESGFDTTFRFGPFSGSTEQFAPVCLNSLLYKYEIDLAWMANQLGKPDEAKKWSAQATARKVAMNTYLWDTARGLYFDYNTGTRQRSTYNYIATFYPLWAGAASPQQAKAVASHTDLFLKPGGFATSGTVSGVQWDAPFGWAPTNYFAVAGLARNGFFDQARDGAKRWNQSVANGYAHDGTVREKYNVVSANANVVLSTGYKQNVIGFGWTNGVYVRFQRFLASSPSDRSASFSALGLTQ